MKIIECVPNFSEGRDKTIIEKIVGSIARIQGIKVLDVDPGYGANRTVVTFVGSPENIVQGAFEGIKTAAELIDMSTHKGEHPRFGAADVVPFIPISGVTMQECVELSKKLAAKVGNELGISVFLYEKSATTSERANLSHVRSGEYEGLQNRFSAGEKPDYGPNTLNAKSGAVAIGAREFLIAYNINLNTKDKKLANDIALEIREQGKLKRDSSGNILKDPQGQALRDPGLFTHVKAIGWVINEYKKAQISINLTNYHVSPPHQVLDAVRKVADSKGIVVTGSEIVGMTPLEVLLQAGRYYLNKMGKPTCAPQSEILECAIQSLGLNDITKFDPSKRIIEFAMKDQQDKLADLSLQKFIYELSSDSKAPGGGSVSALAAALCAGLTAMVANLTYGKKGYESQWPQMNQLGNQAQNLLEQCLKLVDEDTEAYNAVLATLKIPKAERPPFLEEATKQATQVPFRLLELTPSLLEIAEQMIEHGNINSVSDAGVAALAASTASGGAYMNVMINLASLQDANYVTEYKLKAQKIYNQTEEKAKILKQKINAKLGCNL